MTSVFLLSTLLTALAPITPVQEPTPQEYLVLYAESQDLTTGQILTMARIAECESHWNPSAQNPTSSASGIYQVIFSTWEANSKYPWSERYNYKANIETAVELFKRRGSSPWVCK